MICQYCGHKLTDGKCLNPACPGRLRPTGESSNGATSGQDSTLLGPAPAEVEDLLDHIISAANSVSIPSESNYLNELKSRLLAALSNTTPYLSQDVNVPVEKLEAGKEYDMTVRVRIESDVAKMETKPCLWVVIDGDSRKLEAWLRHAKPTFRKAGE
jgi:hypothetical protein